MHRWLTGLPPIPCRLLRARANEAEVELSVASSGSSEVKRVPTSSIAVTRRFRTTLALWFEIENRNQIGFQERQSHDSGERARPMRESGVVRSVVDHQICPNIGTKAIQGL